MHPNALPPPVRKFQRGQKVVSNRLGGIFEIISYTNNTAESMVFIKDINSHFCLTYDVKEDTLTATTNN